MTRSDAAVLFLRMEPKWTMVDDVRRFVETFCATACPGAHREEQVALAAHELVQNAIANAATPDVELEVEVDARAGRVRLSVSNDCAPEQIGVLRARVDRVQAQPDPLAGYLEAMRTDPTSRGGLGLSRVRFESDLDLGVEVHGGRVTVHAAGALAGGRSAFAS